MNHLLEKSIAIVIMLFILSMIAERFVTWIKLYYGKPGRKLWLFSNASENLRREPRTKEEEKAREVKVLGLNIVLSILIATIAHANLFGILSSENPFNGLGWTGIKFQFTFQGVLNLFLLLLGCSLTGLFISLGSKFWHDLLDLLLYTKNLKQKLSEPASYEIESADQLTEFLQFTEADLVRLAIAQNEQALRAKFKNIEFVNDSMTVVNGERKDVLGIFLTDDVDTGLPSTVPVRLPSGKTYQVLTDIIKDVGQATINGGMDRTVSNRDLFNYTGSGCCIVVSADKSKSYLLTCCHVMTDGYKLNPLFATGEPEVQYDDSTIGSWTFGTTTAAGDFALATLTDRDEFLNVANLESFVSEPRSLTKKEDWYKLKVTVRGNKCLTQKSAWLIEVVNDNVRINYKNGEYVKFKTVVLVGDRPDKASCKPLTEKGDSGGAVYDSEMRIVGLVVGSGKNYTYVLPIHDFLASLNLQILSI